MERSKASRLRALLVTKQRKKRRVRSRSQPWGYPKRTWSCCVAALDCWWQL